MTEASKSKQLAEKISDLIRQESPSIPVGLAALSLCLVSTAAIVEIPKEKLKKKMADDIDAIYGLHEEMENENRD